MQHFHGQRRDSRTLDVLNHLARASIGRHVVVGRSLLRLIEMQNNEGKQCKLKSQDLRHLTATAGKGQLRERSRGDNREMQDLKSS